MSGMLWIGVALGIAGGIFALFWRPLRAAAWEAQLARARKSFHWQRERLEIKFIQLATAKARPNGPHWDDCDFDDDVAYVRNRNTKELWAFVAVTVATDEFDDVPSGIRGMVGNLRAGTAVFRFDRGHWETDGRAILNLSPTEAIRFYRDDLEMVDQEFAGQF